jgi:hypothetical protein
MRRHYAFLPISHLTSLKLTFSLCLFWSILQFCVFFFFSQTESSLLNTLNLPVIATPNPLSRDSTEDAVSVWQQATTQPCSQQKDDLIAFVIPAEPDRAISSMLQESRDDSSSSLHDISCTSPTSQVRIIAKCPHWELQALDASGLVKQTGGDEFYITYTDRAHQLKHQSIDDSVTSTRQPHPTAIARLEDLHNGRYILDFISSPLNHRHHRLEGRGTITVAFQYTCGMGRMAPPSKGHWKTGGATVVEHSHAIPMLPQISLFVPSSSFLGDFHDDTGRDAMSPNNNNHNLTSPFFMAFGDSLMQQFVKPLKQVELPNIGMPLNTTTVGDWIQLFQRRMDPKLKLLIQSSSRKVKVVLIVGSSTWDILEPQEGGFDDHKAALEKLIAYFRQTYPETVHLVWKSPTALHVHVPMTENKTVLQKGGTTAKSKSVYNRLKYMSSSRSYQLYKLQLEVCNALQVPILDIYEASYLSADHTLPGDGRHYSDDFNAMTMNWLLRRSTVEQLWNRYYHRGSPTSSRLLIAQHCDSWVDIVNAVIVAMVTNRHLLWQPITECPITADLPFSNRSDQVEAKVTKMSKRTRTMDHRLPFPLTLDILIEEGWISNDSASPSNRLGGDVFDQGFEFLYGMILYELLNLPFPTRNSFNQDSSSSDLSLVFAVYDPSMKSDIRDCIVRLTKNAAETYGLAVLERLSCQVVFASNKAVDKWKKVLQNDHNCTAISVVTNNTNNGSDDESWFHAMTVAHMTHDGYVSQCNSPTDDLFHSLVQYIQTQDAQAKGSLPVEDIQRCCV